MMLSRLIIYNILRWRILKLKTGRLDVYASCWPTFVGVLVCCYGDKGGKFHFFLCIYIERCSVAKANGLLASEMLCFLADFSSFSC